MATFALGKLYSPNGGSWRPPQWAPNKPIMFMVTIQGQQNAAAAQLTQNADVPGGYTLSQTGSTTQIYVFDAVITADHRQEARITEFPVQTGAAISDHAYIMPAEITLDIGMSDAMESYGSSTSANTSIAAGAWASPGSTASKSVAAYNIMLGWMSNRVLMSLTTRLFTYPYIMLASLTPQENASTIASLRCRAVFKQIFLANTQTLSSSFSARPQDTGNTGLGQVSSGPPTTSQVSAYGGNSGLDVPGAGSWSSNSTSPSVLA